MTIDGGDAINTGGWFLVNGIVRVYMYDSYQGHITGEAIVNKGDHWTSSVDRGGVNILFIPFK